MNINDKVLYCLSRRWYDKFYKEVNVNWSISCETYNQIIVSLIRDTDRKSKMGPLIDLIIEHNRDEIMKYMERRYNSECKDYMQCLIIEGSYHKIHEIITLDRRMISCILWYIRNLISTKDKDLICKIFLPIEGDLNTSTINNFVTYTLTDKWSQVSTTGLHT